MCPPYLESIVTDKELGIKDEIWLSDRGRHLLFEGDKTSGHGYVFAQCAMTAAIWKGKLEETTTRSRKRLSRRSHVSWETI